MACRDILLKQETFLEGINTLFCWFDLGTHNHLLRLKCNYTSIVVPFEACVTRSIGDSLINFIGYDSEEARNTEIFI